MTYSITEEGNEYRTLIAAVPDEPGCRVSAEVIIKDYLGRQQVPRIANINWSTGGREWSTDDARAFFRAGVALMDRADELLLEAGHVRD